MYREIITPTYQYGPMQGPMHSPGWDGWSGWSHFLPFGWGGILVLIAIVVLILALARRDRGGAGGGREPETPLEILKKRYARGEISKEEFQNMKKDLEG